MAMNEERRPSAETLATIAAALVPMPVVQKKVVRRGRRGGGYEWASVFDARTVAEAEAWVSEAPAGTYRVMSAADLLRLTDAMLRALRDFAEPGGHGFGEHTYISRSTAHALRDRSLVDFSVRDLGGGRRMAWGTATPEGRAVLRQMGKG